MTTVATSQLPGYSGTMYLSSLPKDLAANPNCQRAISRDLFDAVTTKANWITNPRPTPDIYEPGGGEAELLIAQVLADLGDLKHPYHTRWHTEEVLLCFNLLVENAEVPVNAYVGKMAALFHDHSHCGRTYRQLDDQITGSDLSNEEFAAFVADSFLKSDLSVRERLELQGLILATSFGQANAATLPNVPGVVLRRDYTPTTPTEKLLAFADIGRFMLGSSHHLNGALKMLEESGKIPESFDAWLKGEKGFLGYVQMRFDQVKPLLKDSGVQLIAGKLTELQVAFSAIGNGDAVYLGQFTEVVARMKLATRRA